jgi:hypothetical protein
MENKMVIHSIAASKLMTVMHTAHDSGQQYVMQNQNKKEIPSPNSEKGVIFASFFWEQITKGRYESPICELNGWKFIAPRGTEKKNRSHQKNPSFFFLNLAKFLFNQNK